MKKKNHNLLIAFVIPILLLLFLWVRENEMRVSAESKLSNFQYKTTSVINEKGDTIADLSTQLGEMQAQMQQRTEEYTGALTERDLQIAKMDEDARLAAAEHETAIQEKDKALAALEAEMKETAEKYDAALKKKNTELSEMGEELRKTTERLAGALKEKERAESDSYDFKQELSALERKTGKLSADNKRLEALAKVCVNEVATSTADLVPQ